MIPPKHPIAFDLETSGSTASAENRNTYHVLGAIPVAALALSIVAFAIPREVVAFWPFGSFTRSAEAQVPSIVPDPSLRLLVAATNTDPNPEKGGCELPTTEGSALTGASCPDTAYVEAARVGGSISLYEVRAGDTLSDIAEMFDVSGNTILWANDLKSAKDIRPGETLVILPVTGIRHKVLKGETLASLAKSYGGDADEIASYNGLHGADALTLGSIVIIPGGEIAVAAKPVAKKSGVKQGGSLASIQGKGGGAALPGFFANPVPGAIVTQGVHGWNGVDLGAPSGTSVYAAAGGTVIISKANGAWNGGYGNYVVIDHGNGTQTLYSHLSSVAMSVGSSVTKGALVGGVGRTGEATGNHLHFEVRGAKNPLAGCAVGKTCVAQ